MKMKRIAHYMNSAVLLGMVLGMVPASIFAKKSDHDGRELYDYVIVGAGSAGSLLAYYLSNDKKTSVLVLEEGDNMDTNPTVLNLDFPAGNISSNVNAATQMATSLRHTFYHEWFTVPMAGLNAPPVQNRPILYGGGRLWGGTSTANTQNFLRLSQNMLENSSNGWFAITGDPEFKMGNNGPDAPATAMLRRFKETATYVPADPSEPELYWHGYGNNPDQQNTVFNRQPTQTPGGNIFADLVQNFTNATFLPIGNNYVPNVDTFEGTGPVPPFVTGPAYDRNNPNYPFAITGQNPVQQRADTTRSHSSREFLGVVGNPIDFPNEPVVILDVEKQEATGINGRRLKVIGQSTMLNIQWKKCKKTNEVKAKSVTYLRNGVCHTVCVGKKLILSAGISSAAILLKNGVGPRAQLEAAGIDVILENDQVGQGIENHPNLVIALSQIDIDGHAPRRVLTRARDTNNIATLGLSDASGLAVNDWINVIGVGGTGYNGNNVQVISVNGNEITYFSFGAPEATTNNSSTSTGVLPNTSNVIKVDQLRAGKNTNSPTFGRLPYGWDGLDGGITAENLQRPGKWLIAFLNTASVAIVLLNPAARGFINVINQDPLHPVQCDLRYLAAPSDVTDHIAMIRRIVDLIDYLRNVEGNTHFDIGQAPSRASIAGTLAPAVTSVARDANGTVTLTLAGTPSPAISVGGYVTITDATVNGIADPSINTIGALVTAASDSQISYSTSTKNSVIPAGTPATGNLFDQAALVTFIRNAFNQNHHFASSCRMRKTQKDPVYGDGVVDVYGNVFGTKNVMVCDVSAFPNVGDAGTGGVVYAFALKIVEDLISGRNPKA